MLSVVASLQGLHDHTYNIYEECYVCPYFVVFLNASLSLILQLVLSVVLFARSYGNLHWDLEGIDMTLLLAAIATCHHLLLHSPCHDAIKSSNGVQSIILARCQRCHP